MEGIYVQRLLTQLNQSSYQEIITLHSAFLKSVQNPEQLPATVANEIAFVGRSNCGKSSLLNALLGRRNLARTSATPGRTQMVNFFEWSQGDLALVVADLPGYGFSGTGRSVQANWQRLMEVYLSRPLLQVLFLLDCRRATKLDDEDRQLLSWLSNRQPLKVILTKADKVSRSAAQELSNSMASEIKTLGLSSKISVVSSLKKTGIESLRTELLTLSETTDPKDRKPEA